MKSYGSQKLHSTLKLLAFEAILEPRYTKFSTFTMYLSSILIVGGTSVPLLMVLFFYNLWWGKNLSMLTKTDSIVFADLNTSATSSAKNRSRTVIFFIFDFSFRRAGLNRRSCMQFNSYSWWTESGFNSIEKKIPKRVGARTHPCFTPLFFILFIVCYAMLDSGIKT